VSVSCCGPVVVVYASDLSYPLSGYRSAFIVVTVQCIAPTLWINVKYLGTR
jgi:hypothetical protein